MSGSKMLKCPGCGDTYPEDSYYEVEKFSHDVAKAQGVVFDDIMKSLRGNGLTQAEATAAIGGTGKVDYETAQKIGTAHRQELALRMRRINGE